MMSSTRKVSYIDLLRIKCHIPRLLDQSIMTDHVGNDHIATDSTQSCELYVNDE